MTETINKKILVIGAGLSGIAALKELKEEGHQVTCFEKNEDFGGVFSNLESYDSLHLTISNYFMAYSDFLPSKERLKFWSRRDYKNYLQNYIEHHHLWNHIHFNTEVFSVEKTNNQWKVKVQKNGQDEMYLFDAVAVCSGMFQKAIIPDIEGLENFSGEVIHSKNYKNAEDFLGKKVLCIGLGESSADITSEISEVAEKCILSLRRYPVVAPRMYPFQKDPFFTIDTSPLTSRIFSWLPSQFYMNFTKPIFKKYLRSRNPHTVYRAQWIKKAGKTPHQVITKNERVFKHIVDDQVTSNLSGIDKFTSDEVIFKDGSREKIDAIVFCTGYKISFPFLNISIENPRDLYKQSFHNDMGESLAFIGFVRPQQGGIPAIAEMQSRYFALICSGKQRLPTQQEREEITRQERKFWEEQFYLAPQVTSLVNYCNYMDSMSKLVGCFPNISFFKEPKLYIKLWLGPQFSAQYRLCGPHAKPDTTKTFLQQFPIPMPKNKIALLLMVKLTYELIDKIPGIRKKSQLKRIHTALGS
ncbi:MAG: NAD(P)-binding domain-containing protein [Pseudomonadota bacterium]